MEQQHAGAQSFCDMLVPDMLKATLHNVSALSTLAQNDQRFASGVTDLGL